MCLYGSISVALGRGCLRLPARNRNGSEVQMGESNLPPIGRPHGTTRLWNSHGALCERWLWEFDSNWHTLVRAVLEAPHDRNGSWWTSDRPIPPLAMSASKAHLRVCSTPAGLIHR